MLVKLSSFLATVPHFVLAIALAVSIWGPRVLPMLTGPWAAWSPYLTDAVTFAVGILALAKQFSPGTPAAVASDKAIAAKAVAS